LAAFELAPRPHDGREPHAFVERETRATMHRGPAVFRSSQWPTAYHASISNDGGKISGELATNRPLHPAESNADRVVANFDLIDEGAIGRPDPARALNRLGLDCVGHAWHDHPV
jgi:hypothetical protein